MQWMDTGHRIEIRTIVLEIMAMMIQMDKQLLDPLFLEDGVELLKKYLDISDLGTFIMVLVDLVVKTLYHLVLLIENINYSDDNSCTSILNLSKLKLDLKHLLYEAPFQKHKQNSHIKNQLGYIQTAVKRILRFIDDNEYRQ